MSDSSKANPSPEDIRNRAVLVLNQVLADTVDLRSQARQADLNVKGPYNHELHLLFGGLARDLRRSVDSIAAEIAILGGQAIATVRMAALRSNLRDYPPDALSPNDHLRALLSSYSRYEMDTKTAMQAVRELEKSEANEILEEICALIEQHLWLLEAHLEGIVIGVQGRKLPRWTPAMENHSLHGPTSA
jgi:starvation-inducible DNA-binding protein